MSDIYLVVPIGYQPPPAHTTWQGAAEELANLPSAQYQVTNVELIEEKD